MIELQKISRYGKYTNKILTSKVPTPQSCRSVSVQPAEEVIQLAEIALSEEHVAEDMDKMAFEDVIKTIPETTEAEVVEVGEPVVQNEESMAAQLQHLGTVNKPCQLLFFFLQGAINESDLSAKELAKAVELAKVIVSNIIEMALENMNVSKNMNVTTQDIAVADKVTLHIPVTFANKVAEGKPDSVHEQKSDGTIYPDVSDGALKVGPQICFEQDLSIRLKHQPKNPS